MAAPSTLFERLAIDLNAALGNLQPPVPILPEVVRDFLARLEQGDVEPRVLIDPHRAIFASDEAIRRSLP